MNEGLRRRFWVESGMSAISWMLCLVTVVRKDWIEAMFAVDPDGHIGSLEWTIVFVTLAIAVTAATLARREWRRQAVSA